MTKGGSTKAVRRVAGLLLLTAVLAGCTLPPAPPAQTSTSDEAVQGHAQWCGTNPPSGYCNIDDKR